MLRIEDNRIIASDNFLVGFLSKETADELNGSNIKVHVGGANKGVWFRFATFKDAETFVLKNEHVFVHLYCQG